MGLFRLVAGQLLPRLLQTGRASDEHDDDAGNTWTTNHSQTPNQMGGREGGAVLQLFQIEI
jgi:hypothetical protein